MGVFIICWLPFFIYNIITSLFKSTSHEFIYSFLTWLGYINSGCNPIIYAFNSKDFRRAFTKILCLSKLSGFQSEINKNNKKKNNELFLNEYCTILKNLAPSSLKYETTDYLDCENCKAYENIYLRCFEAKKSDNEKLTFWKKNKDHTIYIYFAVNCSLFIHINQIFLVKIKIN